MLMPWGEFLIVFGLGLLCGLILVGLCRWLRRYLKLRRARATAEALRASLSDDPRDCEAHTRVEACKQRLRWQPTLNPNWLTPLIDETPALIREIAAIYYPDADDPVQAPGLSHFMRAIHLTAADIADFLQTHRLGRLVDVSTHTLWKSWQMSRKIVKHERIRTLHKWYRQVQPWYRKTLPMWQVLRYRSPWMWMSVTASNVVIRTVQPIIIDIIARRAIELYSGRLAMRATKPLEG
jgi:hypothetical protein